jgi:predicted nucleic acid-binding protein
VIVADTNLIAYLLLPGEHTATAEAVVEKDAGWAAPILWRSEFRSVLALFLRRRTLTLDVALEAFRQAEAMLGGREFTVAAEPILQFVQKSRCSAYDCEFAALAGELGVPLVTTDRQLLENFPGLAISPARFAGR